jgi:hypothetical protein
MTDLSFRHLRKERDLFVINVSIVSNVSQFAITVQMDGIFDDSCHYR